MPQLDVSTGWTSSAFSLWLLYDGGLVGMKTARSVEPIRRAAALADELAAAAVSAG